MRRLFAFIVVGSLVAMSVGVAASVATAQQSRYTLDADHALDTDAQKAAFEQSGVATADITAPDLTLTVATEHDVCDIEGFHSDVRNDYFCVEYGEEIDRDLRVFVPDEYWHPYVRETVEPVAGDQPASFEPVRGGDYTAVTMTLDEPGTYAWKINAEASYFSSAKDRTVDRVSEVTGVGVPEREEWQYIDADQLGGDRAAYVVRAPNGTDALVMEYNSSDGWTTVPDSEQEYAPVYWQAKDGVDDRAYVFATTSDPPEVRYKTSPSSRDSLSAALREIGSIPSRVEDILDIDIPFL
jgi:predicted secreted protein